MSLALACTVAFAGGALYESACVFWVHYSEKGRPWATAIMSMLCAAAQLAGIAESVHTVIATPLFILDYGSGTWIAVSMKRRLPSTK